MTGISCDVEPPRTANSRRKIWDGSWIKLPVGQPHIDKALERHSSHCVVAMAIQEAIPDATFVCVDLQTIRWTRRGLRYCCLTPHAARDCIIAFDQGERDKLLPFELKLRPAIISKAGKKRTHTPDTEELKGTGLKVNKVQLHIPEPRRPSAADQRFRGLGGHPPPSTKIALCPQQSKDQLRHELELACANTARLANGEAPEPTDAHASPTKRVARALISTPAAPGSIPVTLGGKMPPVSILSRREFGLRQLRR